jgi:hypothetical protein
MCDRAESQVSHHGALDAEHARQSASLHPGMTGEHIEVISIPLASFEHGKHYKVDVTPQGAHGSDDQREGCWRQFRSRQPFEIIRLN